MRTNHLVIAIILAASAAGAASADTVDLRFLRTERGRSVKAITGAVAQDVFAGQLVHRFSSGTGLGPALAGDRITFCTDLFEYVTTTARTYEITGVENVPDPSMGGAKAAAIGDLYRFAEGSQSRGSTSDDFAAAFQIAIWEIVFDFSAVGGRSSMNVTSGGFQAKKTDGSSLASSIIGHLNNLFDAVGSFGARSADPGAIVGLHRVGAQDQIIEIPLPTPGLLASAGLLSVAAVRRRRA